MNSILIWLGALVALSLLRPILRMIIGRIFAGAIGATALSSQPDTIQLERASASAWKKPAAATAAREALQAAGFADAGTWTVREMPGLVLQLMAHEGESFYAAQYEHPQAGAWTDVVTLYADGTSATFSSNPPTGLNERPGHPVKNFAGMTAVQLLQKARTTRKPGVFAPHTPRKAVDDFTRAYAESTAWRKNKGVSAGEVAKVLKRAA